FVLEKVVKALRICIAINLPQKAVPMVVTVDAVGILFCVEMKMFGHCLRCDIKNIFLPKMEETEAKVTAAVQTAPMYMLMYHLELLQKILKQMKLFVK